MKKANIISTTALASVLALSSANAEVGDLSAGLSLDLNSHFISYGFDVWGAGNDTDVATFNPSVSLSYQATDALSFSTGFWLDVNDNVSSDFETVETDIWFGVSYAYGIGTYSATFQNWQYAGDSEEIIDLNASFDTFLSPSVTIHGRADQGAAGGSEGVFLDLGISHGYDLAEKSSLSLSLNLGVALTEAYHSSISSGGSVDADSGYAYTKLGLGYSYAVSDSASFNAGIAYYLTDEDVVVGNPEEDFLTYSLGVSYSF